MITWIKFSERQPEREGQYLCLYTDRYARVLSGYYSNQSFWDPNWSGDQMQPPDYWAEINPPDKKDIRICEKCGTHYPGKCIEVDSKGRCRTCGDYVVNPKATQMCAIGKLKALIDLMCFLKKEPPMPEKPLCKDCRWILYRVDPPMPGHRVAYCDSPNASHDLVNGGIEIACSLCRSDIYHGGCGPEGKWFEAKQQ